MPAAGLTPATGEEVRHEGRQLEEFAIRVGCGHSAQRGDALSEVSLRLGYSFCRAASASAAFALASALTFSNPCSANTIASAMLSNVPNIRTQA